MCHLHICRELEEGEGEGAGPAVVAPLLTGHTWKSRKIPRNAPALWPISATIVSDFFFLESPSEWVGWVGEEGEGRAKVSEWTRDFRHLDLLGLFCWFNVVNLGRPPPLEGSTCRLLAAMQRVGGILRGGM